MNLSPRQLARLYRVAEIAHALSVAQRDRTERYGQGIEFQRRCKFQIGQKEAERTQRQATVVEADEREQHRAATARLADEMAALQTQLRQSESVTQALQTELEQARPIISDYNERVESIVRFVRATRAELGINFTARDSSNRRADVTR